MKVIHKTTMASRASSAGGLRSARSPLGGAVTKILRHHKRDLPFDEMGNLPIGELIKALKGFQLTPTREEVMTVLLGEHRAAEFAKAAGPCEFSSADDKKRFTVAKTEEGTILVRANQGHSNGAAEADVAMTPITDEDGQSTEAFHGTTQKAWELIQQSGGLKKMDRDHVHFATSTDAKSGIRKGGKFNVILRVDIPAAIKAGIKFYLSANNVICSPGNEDGVIPMEFLTVVQQ